MHPSIRVTLIVLTITCCPCGSFTPHGIDEHYFLWRLHTLLERRRLLDEHYANWTRSGAGGAV